ncbi:hypothetical protein FIBSPDRAFT_1043045 [Athelia psychrophila]|uniref:Uncharacterized protein n=1 Tax=Athelia psychrophila TaxID=1759441 RepID=A0A166LV57_9AGAM|nr:hypothetical protein FIBSPDRAFT_1043045 [Fibularhizoctonia sp. CBS 109695]
MIAPLHPRIRRQSWAWMCFGLEKLEIRLDGRRYQRQTPRSDSSVLPLSADMDVDVDGGEDEDALESQSRRAAEPQSRRATEPQSRSENRYPVVTPQSCLFLCFQGHIMHIPAAEGGRAGLAAETRARVERLPCKGNGGMASAVSSQLRRTTNPRMRKKSWEWVWCGLDMCVEGQRTAASGRRAARYFAGTPQSCLFRFASRGA